MKAYLFNLYRLEIDQVLPVFSSLDGALARLPPRRVECCELLSVARDRIHRHLKPTW